MAQTAFNIDQPTFSELPTGLAAVTLRAAVSTGRRKARVALESK
jgi:hypothetical protein